MNDQQAKELLEKYTRGECTPEEQAWVESWYIMTEAAGEPVAHHEIEQAMAIVQKALPEAPVPVRRLWPRIAAAAAVLLFLSAGGYFLAHKITAVQQTALVQDIAPGSNKAVLTLGNGSKIILTAAKNGRLAQQGNTVINKTAEGQVVYSAGNDQAGNIQYNTIATPRGGQYHLTLADGTNVWLNAASSIKYPTAFIGKERRVEITGEVYFEVIHNAKMPFRVVSSNQLVEDIGTHFNINAYEDESAIKTTLLEGAVKVSHNGEIRFLKPGQQVVLAADNLNVKDADTEETIAWKNGYFRFNNENIASIMRMLSRWYDIDVQYNGKVSAEGFYGRVSRYKNISEVLKMLKQTKGVHFKVEGRRVTVMQ